MEFYDIHEAARKMRVSESTVRKYLGNGKLTGAKIGRIWRISQSDIERFLENAYGAAREKVKADETRQSDAGEAKGEG